MSDDIDDGEERTICNEIRLRAVSGRTQTRGVGALRLDDDASTDGRMARSSSKILHDDAVLQSADGPCFIVAHSNYDTGWWLK